MNDQLAEQFQGKQPGKDERLIIVLIGEGDVWGVKVTNVDLVIELSAELADAVAVVGNDTFLSWEVFRNFLLLAFLSLLSADMVSAAVVVGSVVSVLAEEGGGAALGAELALAGAGGVHVPVGHVTEFLAVAVKGVHARSVCVRGVTDGEAAEPCGALDVGLGREPGSGLHVEVCYSESGDSMIGEHHMYALGF